MKTKLTAVLMTLLAVTSVFAGPSAGPDGETTGNPLGTLSSFLPFIIIIGIFYFLIIRPQSKKRKETEKMLSALKKGDKIVTIGGLYGTIQSVKDTTVILKIDDNVKVEFLRSAISSIVTVSKEKDEPKEIEDNSDGETTNE